MLIQYTGSVSNVIYVTDLGIRLVVSDIHSTYFFPYAGMGSYTPVAIPATWFSSLCNSAAADILPAATHDSRTKVRRKLQNQDHGYIKKNNWSQLIAPYHYPSSGDDESIAIVRYTHRCRHSKEIVGNVGLNFNFCVSNSS